MKEVKEGQKRVWCQEISTNSGKGDDEEVLLFLTTDTGKTIPVVAEPSPTVPQVGPTTAGTEVWWNVRLPDYITPIHYDVELHIDLEKLEFYGDVDIHLKVSKPTKVILVHVNLMNVTSASVVEFSNEGEQV